ncbi:prepilin-type N-terminal cleavage/methylation domain-containing protein [Archangium minus]|uniref:Prepilin-type N-terminal cleavage/methylation domain-containing protein n=1 Tax=Archangium minus TaxID=83450 RepID=A0ABY9WNQ6_9BACT|nr:prepilin-type N-terminal cleavage/methylation domain-containing protein [Archangium minus]
MKRTRRNSGFSLVEMSTVVGIIAILAALSFAALDVLPQRTRLTGGALEFAAAISSARSHAYGRNHRVVLLLNAGTEAIGNPIEYWVVVDPWSNMTATLKANPDWKTLNDLKPGPPAPAGSEYPLFDSGHFNPSVRVFDKGFVEAMGRVAHKGCTAELKGKIALARGPTEGTSTFPPPFCFVPNEKGCTFCTGGGTVPYRGAIFFEPDGTVSFTDALGNPPLNGDGSASISFRPMGGGGPESVQAVVITNTGIVRTFSAYR